MKQVLTQTEIPTETEIKSINLIDGIFTPSEAGDIINAMLLKKINFHKLQIMKIYEGNHEDPCSHDTERLDDLKREKIRLNNILREVRTQGKNMNIQARIDIQTIG